MLYIKFVSVPAVNPRETFKVFSKLQGLQYHFSENFRFNLAHYESEKFFFIPLSITFFESENFRFPFSFEN